MAFLVLGEKFTDLDDLNDRVTEHETEAQQIYVVRNSCTIEKQYPNDTRVNRKLVYSVLQLRCKHGPKSRESQATGLRKSR